MNNQEPDFKKQIIKDKNKIVAILVVSAVLLFLIILIIIGYIVIKINL